MNLLTNVAQDNTDETIAQLGKEFDTMRCAKAYIMEQKINSFHAGLQGIAIPVSKDNAWENYLDAEKRIASLMLEVAKSGNKSLLLDIFDNLQEVQKAESTDLTTDTDVPVVE